MASSLLRTDSTATNGVALEAGPWRRYLPTTSTPMNTNFIHRTPTVSYHRVIIEYVAHSTANCKGILHHSVTCMPWYPLPKPSPYEAHSHLYLCSRAATFQPRFQEFISQGGQAQAPFLFSCQHKAHSRRPRSHNWPRTLKFKA